MFQVHSALHRSAGPRLCDGLSRRSFLQVGTIAGLGLRSPVLAVGDGITDFEIAMVVDAFAAFTGFIRRDAVIARADYVVENFDQLLELVIE